MKDKIVLVTGGGRGIGRAIALAFAAEGSRVAITGRTQAALGQVADEIRKRGAEALARPCDITDKRAVEELQHDVESQFGPVQILVNNAGIAPAAGFLEMEDSLWEKVLRVNLTGTYNCCKVFLPKMVASGWGRIINIASTVAKVAYSHISAYATSKHAVLGLTRSLAVEVAKSGVTVNAICPGYVDTETTRENARLMADKRGKSLDEALDIFRATSPQRRLIDPQEVASLAVVLASETAKGITGQAINVDGGAVMI
ncbi:MAG TPA: SDR family NAD(P)-dependent oxidoreductase [Candidatus Acidoferrales bacterium]|nr:SDR family NAD(P)-dependent oxidoreductase [Candidatus Acidoferrales bacterium]